MSNEINPYEISKDLFSKILSFKFQLIILCSIAVLCIYKKLYFTNFNVLQKMLFSFIPDNIEVILVEISIPILSLLMLVAQIGFVLMIIVIIIWGIWESKDLFNTFVSNYNYYFRGSKIGVVDNLFSVLIARPINYALIILGFCYLSDTTQIITTFMDEPSFTNFPVYLGIGFYSLMPLVFFFNKVNTYDN